MHIELPSNFLDKTVLQDGKLLSGATGGKRKNADEAKQRIKMPYQKCNMVEGLTKHASITVVS